MVQILMPSMRASPELVLESVHQSGRCDHVCLVVATWMMIKVVNQSEKILVMLGVSLQLSMWPR